MKIMYAAKLSFRNQGGGYGCVLTTVSLRLVEEDQEEIKVSVQWKTERPITNTSILKEWSVVKKVLKTERI